MILTEKQRKELGIIIKPAMEYLNNSEISHPHVKIIVNPGCAELVEGIFTDELKD